MKYNICTKVPSTKFSQAGDNHEQQALLSCEATTINMNILCVTTLHSTENYKLSSLTPNHKFHTQPNLHWTTTW